MQFPNNRVWTTHAWRLAFVASGVAMVAEGRMHPDADAKESLRQELATMASDDSWVLAHSLIVLSTVLLAAGLWLADRSRSWPASTHRALRLAADRGLDLRRGDCLPPRIQSRHRVAGRRRRCAGRLHPHRAVHRALPAERRRHRVPRSEDPVVDTLGPLDRCRAGSGRRRAVHALSVPLVLLFPDTELTAAFAGAAILIALWSIGTGLVGLRETVRQPRRIGSIANT